MEVEVFVYKTSNDLLGMVNAKQGVLLVSATLGLSRDFIVNLLNSTAIRKLRSMLIYK